MYLCVFYLSENKQRYVPLTSYKLIGFYNWVEKCLLCGMNWVFKYSSLCFVFKKLVLSDLCVSFLPPCPRFPIPPHCYSAVIDLKDWVEKCLLCGMNWVFKYSSLCFVFKRLVLSDLCVSFLPPCPLFPISPHLFCSYWPQGLKDTIDWSTVATKVLAGIFSVVGWSFIRECLCSRQANAAAGRQKMLICPFLVTGLLIFWPLNFENLCHPDYNISGFLWILILTIVLYSNIPPIL